MKRYEYKATCNDFQRYTVEHTVPPEPPDGDDTWELVAAIPAPFPGDMMGVIWYWRRPKKKPRTLRQG